MLTLVPTPAPRLLLVDSDPDVADTLQRSLRRAGWEVLRAATGWMALQLLVSCTPDLALVSLSLPDMDGRKLVEQLARDRRCAVVAMSGGDESPRQRLLDGGAQDYLVKPMAMRDMLVRLQDALQRRAGPGLGGADGDTVGAGEVTA